MADLGFSRGGAPTPKLGLFCIFLDENCMKMKEFVWTPVGGGGEGGNVPGALLRSANGMSEFNMARNTTE